MFGGKSSEQVIYSEEGLIMAKIVVRKGEDVNRAIRRFKKKVESEGIMRDIKKKRYYLKPSEAKKVKRKLAEKRRRKSQKKQRER